MNVNIIILRQNLTYMLITDWHWMSIVLIVYVVFIRDVVFSMEQVDGGWFVWDKLHCPAWTHIW